jgi:hypothetical protein
MPKQTKPEKNLLCHIITRTLSVTDKERILGNLQERNSKSHTKANSSEQQQIFQQKLLKSRGHGMMYLKF